MFQKLIAKLLGVSEAIWTYIHDHVLPILEADAKGLIPQLAPIAEQAVVEVFKQGKVSSDAFNSAKSIVIAGAESAGIDVVNSVLNYVIQSAYDKQVATGAIIPASANSANGTLTGSPAIGSTPTA